MKQAFQDGDRRRIEAHQNPFAAESGRRGRRGFKSRGRLRQAKVSSQRSIFPFSLEKAMFFHTLVVARTREDEEPKKAFANGSDCQ